MNTRTFWWGAALGLVVGVMLMATKLARTESRLAQYEAQEAAMEAHRQARATNDSEIELDLATERLSHA